MIGLPLVFAFEVLAVGIAAVALVVRVVRWAVRTARSGTGGGWYWPFD